MDDQRVAALEVGFIVKPHGVAGDVVVELYSPQPQRTAVGAVFRTVTSNGTELTVTKSRAHQSRFVVRFAQVSDRNDAERLVGTRLFAEPLTSTEGMMFVHELIGCQVEDQDGVQRGLIVEVEPNPASDLLVLESGALVPMTFVKGSPRDGTVQVTVPAGLFELFDEKSV